MVHKRAARTRHTHTLVHDVAHTDTRDDELHEPVLQQRLQRAARDEGASGAHHFAHEPRGKQGARGQDGRLGKAGGELLSAQESGFEVRRGHESKVLNMRPTLVLLKSEQCPHCVQYVRSGDWDRVRRAAGIASEIVELTDRAAVEAFRAWIARVANQMPQDAYQAFLNDIRGVPVLILRDADGGLAPVAFGGNRADERAVVAWIAAWLERGGVARGNAGAPSVEAMLAAAHHYPKLWRKPKPQ